MSNNDRIDMGAGEQGFARHGGLASNVPGGNSGTCANLSCRQFSTSLHNGYCPICASGRGPAPITGGRPIPQGHGGFHLTAPQALANCAGGVCSVPAAEDTGDKGGDKGCSGTCDGNCVDCKCGGSCACGK